MKFNYWATISATAQCVLNLYPEDFLYCNSEAELDNEVRERLADLAEFFSGDYSNVDIYDDDFEYPERFVEEWKYLKKLNDEI